MLSRAIALREGTAGPTRRCCARSTRQRRVPGVPRGDRGPVKIYRVASSSGGISIAGQRFITTLSPRSFGAGRRRLVDAPPSCIHTALAPIAIAWSTASPASLGAAEGIDHIDRLADSQRGLRRRLRRGCVARGERVDRDRAVAVALQVAHDAMARALRPRAGADHGDRLRAGQDLAQVVVGIACRGSFAHLLSLRGT